MVQGLSKRGVPVSSQTHCDTVKELTLKPGREGRQGPAAPQSKLILEGLFSKAVTWALISVFHIYRLDPWEFLANDSN